MTNTNNILTGKPYGYYRELAISNEPGTFTCPDGTAQYGPNEQTACMGHTVMIDPSYTCATELGLLGPNTPDVTSLSAANTTPAQFAQLQACILASQQQEPVASSVTTYNCQYSDGTDYTSTSPCPTTPLDNPSTPTSTSSGTSTDYTWLIVLIVLIIIGVIIWLALK